MADSAASNNQSFHQDENHSPEKKDQLTGNQNPVSSEKVRRRRRRRRRKMTLDHLADFGKTPKDQPQQQSFSQSLKQKTFSGLSSEPSPKAKAAASSEPSPLVEIPSPSLEDIATPEVTKKEEVSPEPLLEHISSSSDDSSAIPVSDKPYENIEPFTPQDHQEGYVDLSENTPVASSDIPFPSAEENQLFSRSGQSIPLQKEKSSNDVFPSEQSFIPEPPQASEPPQVSEPLQTSESLLSSNSQLPLEPSFTPEPLQFQDVQQVSPFEEKSPVYGQQPVSPFSQEPEDVPQPFFVQQPAPQQLDQASFIPLSPYEEEPVNVSQKEVHGVPISESSFSASPSQIVQNKPSFQENIEKEELVEKKNFVQLATSAGMVIAQKVRFFLKNFPGYFSVLSSVVVSKRAIVQRLVLLLILLLILYLGYVFQLYQNAFQFISGFFASRPPEQSLLINPQQRDSSLMTVLLFGKNEGSIRDRIPSYVMISRFFGSLQEPVLDGDTGVFIANYYATLRDFSKEVNEFVVYVNNLEKLQNLYKIDIYAMLDQTPQRDQALFVYLDELRQIREESLLIEQRIHLNQDDLRISYESLGPDKIKYEKDFFASLEVLQGEKGDFLLKGFIDIAQKQIALKARINALQQLGLYYKNALLLLDKRIEAIDRNREALIQGIKVVDIPGANVDIIIRLDQ